ncbi:MAG: glycosyltransferase [Desulfobacteraceae bacterium]|nr:MAG: glycosyltransferase [Desulfobacteraceae bacterium]
MLSLVRALGDEFIVVCQEFFSRDIKPPMPVIFIPAEADLAAAAGKAVKKATGDWILMLTSNENISSSDCEAVKRLSRNHAVEAYYLIAQNKLEPGALGKYERIANKGKYSNRKVQIAGYIPAMEIRFFQKSVFKKIFSVCDDSIHINLIDNHRGIAHSGIRLITQKDAEAYTGGAREEENHRKDFMRFTHQDEEIPGGNNASEMNIFGTVGFSLISEKDLPSLEAGLEMGFGSINLFNWAVHQLIKKGRYNLAVSLAEKVISRFPGNYEIWHLRGIAFFYTLNLVDAEKSMKKALEQNGKDKTTLSDLARVLIASGRLNEAIVVLEKVRDIHGLTPENEYILKAIKNKSGKTAGISLLMLCRDEEEYLERALKSVKDLVDEIIAVDTGSTDKSLEILEKNGAKIIRHPWNDDFSEARNAGLDHVTHDYVFWMDADEFLEDKTRLSFYVFKHLLPINEKQAVIFDVKCFFGSLEATNLGIPPTDIIKRTSIFPNLKTVRFQGNIFETVEQSLAAAKIPVIFAENIFIKHHNDNNEFRNRRKISAMFKSGTASHRPEDFFRNTIFWLDAGNVLEAADWFEGAVIKADGDRKYLDIICRLFSSFALNGKICPDSRIFRELLSRYGNSYRIASLCADCLYRFKEYSQAAELLKKLASPEYQPPHNARDHDLMRNNWLMLSMASLELDDYETSDSMLDLLSMDNKTADTARAVSFYKAIRVKDLDAAIAVLDKWIRERNIPIRSTIDDFAGFIRLIGDIAEVAAKYGQTDAGKVLLRSAEYFTSTITPMAQITPA